MAIFVPKKEFAKVSSIFLLQNQLKRIRNLTNEDMVGLVRIAWWKEEVAKIFSGKNSQNHYLLNEIKKFKNEIDSELLNQCFQGFERDFVEEKDFKNSQELQNYIFQTQTIFYLTILQLIVPKIKKDLQKKIAENLGFTAFYIDLLKKIKLNDERVLCVFRSGFFGDFRFDLKSWQGNKDEENLRLIVKNICLRIENLVSELEKSKISKSLPIKALMIKSKIAKTHLQSLGKNQFDITASNLAVPNILFGLI
jgi:hypothetical protein